ncbi:MAG TPA: ATP-binding cassette domain-containing protein, partial [Nitrospiria bacterium]|nr:ATP-binding cassette domain-containing protein [Nitrospiria bacterium]
MRRISSDDPGYKGAIEAMIEVSDLTKYYGSVRAIDRVGFKVGKGEIVAFLGPNGAGKTTTMKILTGFIPASSGSAVVAGFDVFESPIEVKKRIGYLPETPPLYQDMTVSEYLRFVGKIKQIPGKQIHAALDRVIAQCRLETVQNRLIRNLSKGFQQRVGLAQALIHNPEILILDEPTVGLDPHQIIEIRELIRGLAGDHTVILSTHILQEATAVCQRVLIINEGKIVAEDTPERLSADIRKNEKVTLLIRRCDDDLVGLIKAITGMTAVKVESKKEEDIWTLTAEYSVGSDLREAIAKTVVQKGAGLLELK